MNINLTADLFSVPKSCVSQSHVAEENNKRFIVDRANREIYKIKLDYDGRNTNQKIVDYAFLIQSHIDSNREIILVELKGSDVKYGFEQIEASLNKFCINTSQGNLNHENFSNIWGNHNTKAFIISKKNPRLQQNQRIKAHISNRFGVTVMVRTQEYHY